MEFTKYTVVSQEVDGVVEGMIFYYVVKIDVV